MLPNAHIIPPYWHHLQPQHPGPVSGKATSPFSLPHPHGKLRAQSFTLSDVKRLPAVGRQLSPCQRPNGEHAKLCRKEAPGELSLCGPGTRGNPQPLCPTSPPLRLTSSPSALSPPGHQHLRGERLMVWGQVVIERGAHGRPPATLGEAVPERPPPATSTGHTC